MSPFRTLAASLLILALATAALSRPIGIWSYQDLFDKADVVVIGRVASTRPAEKPEGLQGFADVLEGQATKFQVEGVLKGKAGKEIEVLHCRMKENRGVANGPLLAEFRQTGRRLKVVEVDGVKEMRELQEAEPRYLLFLKEGKDGRLEPVAGQIDSLMSVREVRGPW